MSLPTGVEITAEITPEFSEVLTHDALVFVAKLQREFGARRDQALERRKDRQLQFDAGQITQGSDAEQAMEAVDLINQVLQAQPYGLAAQLIATPNEVEVSFENRDEVEA